MASVVVEMTGNEANLFRKLAKLEKKNNDLRGQLRGVKKDSRKAFDDNPIIRMANSAKGMAAALAGSAGVLGVMKLITAEIRQQIELQEKQAKSQITLNQARQGLIRNLPTASDQEIKALLASGTQIAAKTGVQEKVIADALAQAVSASGGNIKASKSAVTVAARFLADLPDQIAPFSGSLLDISKATGTQDAQANLGFVRNVAGLSRVVDPKAQALSIPRSVIGQTKFGATSAEGAAFFAALTNSAADFRGETSATATVSFQAQLKDFFRKKRSPELRRLAGEDATFTQRLTALRTNPALARQFASSSSFEKTVLGPLRDFILNPDSEIANQFRGFRGQIPTDVPSLRRLGQQSFDQRGLDPLESVAQTKRVLDQASNDLLTQDAGGGRAGVVREGLFKLLEATGLGSTAESLAKLKFEANTGIGQRDVLDTGIDIVRDRTEDIRPNRLVGFTNGGGFVGGGTAITEPVPDRELDPIVLRQIQVLERVAAELTQIKNNTADTARKTTGNPAGGVPPNTDERGL